MDQGDINNYYYNLKKILQIEKEEDLIFHKTQLETLTDKQKQETGYLWKPVTVTSSGFTMGGRIFIQVERKSVVEFNNQLLPGRPVIFFSEGSTEEKTELKATVYSCSKNTLKLIANSRDLPEWLNKPPLCVELDFDERTYRLMEQALENVINSKDQRVKEFKRLFQGLQNPEFCRKEHNVTLPNLNESQNSALNYVLSSKDLAIIHGPPGTGKTTTLVQIIKETLLTEKQVLVTAPSNVAVDVLVERLAAAGVKTVRTGNISRIDETLIQHSLDALVESHREFSNIKKIKIEAAAIRAQSRKYKRHFSQALKLERAKLKEEAKQMDAWARELENRITQEILDNAQVIATTLTSCNNDELAGRNYSTVFLDEASQALEPACWIAFLKSSRIVMAGDPLQLPPTVKSGIARKEGLDISLLEKCIDLEYYTSMLTTQYRMQDEIMAFSNMYFYEGKLTTAETIKAERTKKLFKPLMFIDTAGTGFEEQVTEDVNKDLYQSRFNEGEYFILREHILKLHQIEHFMHEKDIAIITPYRAQVKYIQEQLLNEENLKPFSIRVSSIDGYQGQESDIVIISLVRSNPKAEIGFLNDYRRMNVALTRARLHLAIIGDSATLCSDKFYNLLLDHVNQNDQYHSAYEYMY